MNEETRKRRMSRFDTEDFFSFAADGNESYENPIEITVSHGGSKDDFMDKQSTASTEESTNASINAPKESSSTFWKDLRRKILFDLQRHFKRKVDHDRLISSLCKYFCRTIITYSLVILNHLSFDIAFTEVIYDLLSESRGFAY